jgi:hypothetical protein
MYCKSRRHQKTRNSHRVTSCKQFCQVRFFFFFFFFFFLNIYYFIKKEKKKWSTPPTSESDSFDCSLTKG